MGKAARRSVASDPSSPTLSFLHSSTTSTDASSFSRASAFASTSHHNIGSSSFSSFPSSNQQPPKIATLHPKLPSLLANSEAFSQLDATGALSTSTSSPQLTTPVFSNYNASSNSSTTDSTAAVTTATPTTTTTTSIPTTNATGTSSSDGGKSPGTASVPGKITDSVTSNSTQRSSSLSPPSSHLCSNQTQADWSRERQRMEFYATYDVMTGVRIAATLGGFFGLMVFLVIYKSRSRSTAKALKDPTIAAVAAAVIQEEEERELQEAIEATAFSLLQEELHVNYPGLKRDRLMSLGNVSAPPMLNRNYRFSSVGGGYSSLLNPQRRYSYASSRSHRNSVSVSSRILSAYNMGDSFGQDDYFLESDGEEADDEFDQYTTTADVGYSTSNYLMVPGRGTESRRSSAMTCCSTESSFLERRCSAITLGLSSLPPMSRSQSRRQSRDDRRQTAGNGATLGATCADWDAFYPGINIIEATPKSSPCPSERIAHTSTGLSAREQFISRKRSSYDESSIDCISAYPDTNGADINYNHTLLRQNYGSNTRIDDISIANRDPSGSVVRRAPLASLSSFKMSSAECQDSDLHSCGSDSVFDDSCADTDEDLQQFSTDSDELSIVDEGEYSATPVAITIPGTSTSATGSAETARAGVTYGGASSSSSSSNQLQPPQYEVARGTASDTIYVDIEKPNDTSCLSSLSNSNRRAKSKLKSDKVNLGTRIETKAIIERQQQNDSRDHSPSPRSPSLAVPQLHAAVSPITGVRSLPSNPPPSSHSISHYTKDNSLGSTNRNNNNDNDDNSNPVEDESNNKCVEVNVIIKNHSSNIKNPSVILELPILTIDEDNSQPPLSPVDPSIPGPSRKWSKETLF
ncbi:serine-rich adhesin for platelets isoform X2 [Wyeomyia smithii]|uniref:serine-rich adhesin for platelets isoform X2 n=1 Tax=Wyeomyia smithii TaxID=174621 RepID=UPI002467DC7D|nr:serine-rich adhesin for platelets isoform X2 [Wyeomyia smithii]